MPTQKKTGFTLIELLISISIIAILSVIGMVSYTNFLKGARDNKRQADLKFIQSALEEYHSDLLVYPTAPTVSGNPGFNTVLPNGGVFNSDTGRGTISAPTTQKIYFNAVPRDPTQASTFPYCYTTTPALCVNNVSNNCTSYTLYARLENSPTGVVGYPYSCGGRTNAYNFMVTQP